MSTVSTLLTPLSYLRVKHPLKRVVDIWFPGIGSLLAILWISLWSSFNLFGSSGAAVGINGLIQLLAGFFITSLAAIATFNGSVYRIDEVFEGEKALLGGDALTRRQFLSYLFAYLALLSVLLYLYGAIAIAAASTLHDHMASPARLVLRIIFAASYSLALSHVIGTTLVGLVFLCGRLPGPVASNRFIANPKGVAAEVSRPD